MFFSVGVYGFQRLGADAPDHVATRIPGFGDDAADHVRRTGYDQLHLDAGVLGELRGEHIREALRGRRIDNHRR